jgi:inorganic pyrophosphatase
MVYPINYGFIAGTQAPDGKEIDAFILGVDKPLISFTGQCIAVIHRLNDIEDKLVVAPEHRHFSDEEIRQATYFQEKFFESVIQRE